MTKALYSLKTELLRADTVIWLRGCELQVIQHLNRFVVNIYTEARFTYTSAVDAPVSDVKLTEKCEHYDDKMHSQCCTAVDGKTLTVLCTMQLTKLTIFQFMIAC